MIQYVNIPIVPGLHKIVRFLAAKEVNTYFCGLGLWSFSLTKLRFSVKTVTIEKIGDRRLFIQQQSKA